MMRLRVIFKPLIMCLLLSGCVIGASMVSNADSYQDEIAASREKIADNNEKIAELNSKKSDVNAILSELSSLKADAAAYIEKLDQELSVINDELDELEAELIAIAADIEQTEADLAVARDNEAEQYASMKLRVKYMYERGGMSIIGELLSSGSLADLLNKAEYIERISEYDRNKLDEYVEIKHQIEAKEEELRSEEELMRLTEETLNSEKENLEELEAEKQAELNAYNAKIASAEAELSEMNTEIAGIQAAIQTEENNIAAAEARIRAEEEAKRQAAIASGQSYSTISVGDISFIWPCPSSSRISSYFGDRESPTEGASTNHKGIDIAASTGSAVLAAAGGTVAIATYSSSAGNYIMISHGAGVYTVYMHMSSMAVSVGDSVSKGQTIGAVGSTGYSTGPHLHFGIRIDGTYVNPLGYVSP